MSAEEMNGVEEGGEDVGGGGGRKLTGEEAEVYDRQIRLWGLAAQQRLSSSKVLMIGGVMSTLGCEIAKNIVLAGVGCMDIIAMGDMSGNGKDVGFFGEGSVEEVVGVLREMNPLIEVGVKGFEEVEEFVGEYEVVCCVGVDGGTEERVGRLCREKGCMFFTGVCLGLVGCFFMDLGERFWYEVEGEEGGRVEVEFCSWDKALEADWSDAVKKSDGGWPIVCAMREFGSIHGRYPKSGVEEDEKQLEKVYVKMATEKGLVKQNLDLLKSVGRSCNAVVPPVTAIVGGVWAREVVKCIGRKDQPLKNFFFFNAKSTIGTVEVFGE